MCGILYDITQTYGVTVAQVILVHFVEVRILVGLPFFLSFSEMRCDLALSKRALTGWLFAHIRCAGAQHASGSV